MKHIFKIFLGLCVVLAIAGPVFVAAQFPGDCPLSCSSGQVCELDSSGTPQCVAADPFPQDCPLSCPSGQVCERDAGGTPQCVAGEPDPSPDPGSTYNPPNLPINTNLPITGAVPISGPGGQGPAGLIANFYSFAFLIAGFLAFVMIVYGGVRYTFSGGNHSAKEEAKEAIRQALIGLGLLLVAYLILRTINPDLTKLQLPTLAPYTPVPVATGPTEPTDACGGCPVGSQCVSEDGETPECVVLQSTCSAAQPLSRLTGDAATMEAGATVVFTSSNPDIQRNLSRLSNAVTELQQGIAALGGQATVNSAYRPYQYQRHFWEICDRRDTLAQNTDPGCATLKSEVETERARHGINPDCVVAQADGCAPHVKGVAVDMTITGVTQAQINSIAARASVGLRWSALPGDPFHYELVNPPFAGCAPRS